MKYVDLHNHTTASDGLLSPDMLVEWAAKKGLHGVAITDHDTTQGIGAGIEAGKKYGIDVVPGIELNTQIGNNEIHILGYYISAGGELLEQTTRSIREDRYNRTQKIVENLNKLYNIDITFDEVKEKSGTGSITRPHIGRVLVDKGVVSDLAEAFEKYIGNDCPAYVSRRTLSPKQGIDLIKSAGGVPVLAHPGLLKNKRLINILVDSGILGLEAYHSKHTREQSIYFEKLAGKNNLIVTGGSDCHGELVNGQPTVGNVKVEYNVVKQLKNASDLR